MAGLLTLSSNQRDMAIEQSLKMKKSENDPGQHGVTRQMDLWSLFAF